MIQDPILKIVGMNNARAFLGESAAFDEEWVEASVNFSVAAFETMRKMKRWPSWMRGIVWRLIPERAAMKEQWAKGRKRIKACIQERADKGGNIQDPPTALDHLSSGKNAHLANDVESQLSYQMTLAAVGTMTTYSSALQAIYDLALHPEYIAPLREEIEAAPVDENGMYTKDALSGMRKLDSFIKESQRLAPTDLSTSSQIITPYLLILTSS